MFWVLNCGFKWAYSMSMFKTYDDYTFTPLNKSLFPLIENWLKESHLIEFWDDISCWEESYEHYLFRTSPHIVKQFIVYFESQPIGYIQYYFANKLGYDWWLGYPDSVVGIDKYIRNPKYLGHGHGHRMIKAFIQFVCHQYPITKVITDPSPENLRAIKCYEKVGFMAKKNLKTPDEDAVLMEYPIT